MEFTLVSSRQALTKKHVCYFQDSDLSRGCYPLFLITEAMFLYVKHVKFALYLCDVNILQNNHSSVKSDKGLT